MAVKNHRLSWHCRFKSICRFIYRQGELERCRAPEKRVKPGVRYRCKTLFIGWTARSSSFVQRRHFVTNKVGKFDVKKVKNKEAVSKINHGLSTLPLSPRTATVRIPAEWKSSAVRPIYKECGNKQVASNYRPISLLWSKICGDCSILIWQCLASMTRRCDLEDVYEAINLAFSGHTSSSNPLAVQTCALWDQRNICSVQPGAVKLVLWRHVHWKDAPEFHAFREPIYCTRLHAEL